MSRMGLPPMIETAAQKPKTEPSTSWAIGDAIKSEWSAAALLRQAGRTGFEVDDTWTGIFANDDTFNRYTQGLDPSFHSAFVGTVSDKHATKIREQMLGLQEARGRLEQMGWAGTALRIGANVLDPVNLAVGAATGGIGWASRGTKLARFMKSGLISGASAGAFEAYMTSEDPQRSAADVILASSSSFLLGGLIGSLGQAERKALADAVQRASDDAVAEPIKTVTGYLIPADAPVPYRPNFRETAAGRAMAVNAKVRDLLSAHGETYQKSELARILGVPDRLPEPKPQTELDQLLGKPVAGLDAGVIPKSRGDTLSDLLDQAPGTSPEPVYRRPTGQPQLGELKQSPLSDADMEEIYRRAVKEAAIGEIRSAEEWDAFRKAVESPYIDLEQFKVVERVNNEIAGGTRPPDPSVSDSDIPRGGVGAASAAEFYSPDATARYAIADQDRALREQIARAAQAKAKTAEIDQLIEKAGFDPVEDAELVSALREVDPDSLLSRWDPSEVHDAETLQIGLRQAASNVGSDGLGSRLPTDFNPVNVSAAVSDNPLNLPRFDMAHQVGVSPAPAARTLVSLLAQNPLLRKIKDGYAPSVQSASEWRRIQLGRLAGEFSPRFSTVRNDWLRENGFTLSTRSQGIREFNVAVSRAVRSDYRFGLASGEVKKAAQLVRQEMAESLGLMKRHGVKGAAQVEENANYLSRLWSTSRVQNAIANYGEEWVGEFVTRSIQAINPDIDAKIAARMGRGMVRIIQDLDLTDDIGKARLFNLDEDGIARILKAESSSITDADIEAITKSLAGKNDPDVGKPSRLRSRVLLDEQYMDRAPDGRTVTIDEFFENDAEKLVYIARSQAIGASAESVILKEMSRFMDPTGERVYGDWDALRSAVRRQMRDSGAAPSKVDADMEVLDLLHRHVRGVSTDPDWVKNRPWLRKAARTLTAFNYLRLAGGFAIAQVPEIGNIIGEAGFKVLAQQAPAIGEIFKKAADGTLENQLLRELVAISGQGTERMVDIALAHLDDVGTGTELALSKSEEMLARLNRLQNDVSGFTGVDAFSRRLAGLAAVQHIANAAQDGSLSAKRLLDLGMTEAQAKKVFAQINRYVDKNTETGQVVRLNLEKWSDRTAATQFAQAVAKWSGRVIQTNDIGMANRFMTGTLGRVIFQFRSFMLNAWTTQTLHKIQQRDMAAFNGAMMTSLLAGLAWTGQSYIQSLGRKDAEEFRKERLSAGTIAKMAFARGGWSSIAPSIVDFASVATGADAGPFSMGRHTQLSSTSFLGNPSTIFMDDMLRVGRAVGRKARGAVTGEPYDMTQADVRAMLSISPWRNLIGYKNVLDAIVSSQQSE